MIERPATLPETSEEDEEVDINKLLNEMSDEQAYQLLQKAERHAATLPEPKWSQKEGAWKRAEAGLMDGMGPERYRSDELRGWALERKEKLDGE